MEVTSLCCYDNQIVDGKGNYKVENVKNFMKATNLSDRDRSYAVVAILGVQHGGKSTIMNHLFGTNFRQMDPSGRRKKTTQGIWIAKSPWINDPPIIALDIEGIDGREKGEDDTAFEKQSAVLALAVADVVIINMWCSDLGREQASNKPLLKIVFEVRMRMSITRKVTLLFVLRDKTQVDQFESLKSDVGQDIQEIWGTVAKRHPDKQNFSKYFHVEVFALSNYHDKKELFEEQVAEMRERYFGYNLVRSNGDIHDRLPASEFAVSTEQLWHDIKRNKELNLAAYRVMVETFWCHRIADDMFGLLRFDEGWLDLEKAAHAANVSGFGRKFRSILATYLTRFDKKAMFFDEGIRNKQRQDLQTKVVKDLAHPAFLLLVANFRSKALKDLTILFEDSSDRQIGFPAALQQCLLALDDTCKDAAIELIEWDTSDAREKLQSDINIQLELLRNSKLSQLKTVAKDQLSSRLQVIYSIVTDGGDKMWKLIRECLVKETDLAVANYAYDIAHLGSEEAAIDLQMNSLRDHAKTVAEQIVREEREGIRSLLVTRFKKLFNHNDDGTVRDWTKVGGIKKLCFEASKESLSLLAAMAATRFSGKADNIRDQLFSELIVGSASREKRQETEIDLQASRKWVEVSSSNTLITPEECQRIWAEFKYSIKYIVDEAKEIRLKYKCKKGLETTLDVTEQIITKVVVPALPVVAAVATL